MKKYSLTILFGLFTVFYAMGQCYPDRHSTSWYDGWISCEKAANPNDVYEASHWILYDLNENFELGKMHVWNSNDPSHLDYGMNEVNVDYSLDGIEWINLGLFYFDPATGKSIYEGFEGPDFGGVLARYVLLTAMSNYGGECYGLSEIKIEVEKSTVGIEETDFSVNCVASDEGMFLEWTVDGKLDGVRYQIERSDNTNDWMRIKETEEFNLGEGKHTFHYIDNGVTDRSAYYRLITVDRDGGKDVSKSHYCSTRSFDARVYPNPMGDQAYLEISSQDNAQINYSIFDNLGRQQHAATIDPVGLMTRISLDQLINGEGHYFVIVRQGDKQRSVKLIKF